MSIDAATVRRIAHLARVAVADDEVEHLRGEINAILSFVEQHTWPTRSTMRHSLSLRAARLMARRPSTRSEQWTGCLRRVLHHDLRVMYPTTPNHAAANGGIALQLQSARLGAAVADLIVRRH